MQTMVDPLVKFHNEVWGSFSDNPTGQGHFFRYCVMFYSFRITKFRKTCLVSSKKRPLSQASVKCQQTLHTLM